MPVGFQEVEAPRISVQSAYEGGKVSPTHRPLLPPGKIAGTRLCQRLSRPQGLSAAGRIKSMKNFRGPIGNRTCDLPAVPQPAALPSILVSVSHRICHIVYVCVKMRCHRLWGSLGLPLVLVVHENYIAELGLQYVYAYFVNRT